jgi:ketosteroid isomerase-like protein
MPAEKDDEYARGSAVAEQEKQAAAAGDIEAYVALLADDAIFMAPATSMKAGEELREWLAGFLEQLEVTNLRKSA